MLKNSEGRKQVGRKDRWRAFKKDVSITLTPRSGRSGAPTSRSPVLSLYHNRGFEGGLSKVYSRGDFKDSPTKTLLKKQSRSLGPLPTHPFEAMQWLMLTTEILLVGHRKKTTRGPDTHL